MIHTLLNNVGQQHCKEWNEHKLSVGQDLEGVCSGLF